MRKICEHSWTTETLREPDFQVAYGAVRVCAKCRKRQFADYTAGRIGGDFKDSKEKKNQAKI